MQCVASTIADMANYKQQHCTTSRSNEVCHTTNMLMLAATLNAHRSYIIFIFVDLPATTVTQLLFHIKPKNRQNNTLSHEAHS